MAGNLAEWNGDWLGSFSSDPQIDPYGEASASERVIRGGRWNHGAPYLQSTNRNFYGFPTATSYGIGFRVCRTD